MSAETKFTGRRYGSCDSVTVIFAATQHFIVTSIQKQNPRDISQIWEFLRIDCMSLYIPISAVVFICSQYSAHLTHVLVASY